MTNRPCNECLIILSMMLIDLLVLRVWKVFLVMIDAVLVEETEPNFVYELCVSTSIE